jgi:hypothetical protein
MSPTFDGTIHAGTLSLDNKPQFLSHLQSLDGKRVQVTVDHLKQRRKARLKRFVQVLRLLAGVLGRTGRIGVACCSSSQEKVRRWAAEELNIVIPSPEEVSIGT